MTTLDRPPTGPTDNFLPPTTPERRRRGRLLLGFFATALVAFLVGVGVGASTPTTAPGSTPTPTSSVYMPNVVGVTAQAAADQLSTMAGIPNVNVTGGAANRYNAVTRQTPAAGTLINSSTVVTLYTAQSAPAAPSYVPAPTYVPPLTASAAPSVPAAPASIGSGTWEVGTGPGEVRPGTYRAAAGSSSCYYERLSGLDGEFGSIITNNGEYNGGPVTVAVGSSDAAFKVSGDCVFVRR